MEAMSVGEPVGGAHRFEAATSRAPDADPAEALAGKSVRGIQRRRIVHRPGTTHVEASSVPPVELPAPVERLASAAARAMGWQGILVPRMKLAGRHVAVVARLRTAVHAERICFGAEPVPDRATVATWMWPEFADSAPALAVDIVGVLGIARHWRTGLASAAPFTQYCETGVVVPWDMAMTNDYMRGCLTKSAGYGVSVLTADPEGETHLDQEGARSPEPVAATALTRWLNELVYQRVLDTVEESIAAG
jgi:hypothetical protein